MATGLSIWSKTAASNASADSAVNWAEGQAPSSVNDSARGMMASVAKWRDDNNGTLTTGGTSTAYTLTSNQVFASLTAMDGATFTFVPNATSGAAPTLAIDGLAAKNINIATTVNVPTGYFIAGTPYRVTYFNSTTEFIVQSATTVLPSLTVTGAATVGTTLGVTGVLTQSSTSHEALAKGTTAQRPGSPASGNFRFNTDTGFAEFYDGSNWVSVLSSLSGAQLQYGAAVNLTIAEANATNAVTFTIKTLAGNTPSSSDPVLLAFRNSTLATGNYVYRTITGALTFTISSGSTLGTVSGLPFRLWLVLFDDAGTIRLGVIKCRSAANIYPLGQIPRVSSTAEGGAGAADSAQVFYTGTAVTSKPYIIIGYANYESGIATAGSWNASPTSIQLFGSGMPLPGQPLQTLVSQTGAVATGTIVVPDDDTIPQNNEGDEYMSQAVTPTSGANVLRIRAQGSFASSAGGGGSQFLCMALFQDSTANALTAVRSSFFAAANSDQPVTLEWDMAADTSSATTFKIRAGGHAAGTTTFNGNSGARKLGGVMNSFLKIEEVMA